MNSVTKMSAKGQVVIPKDVRDRLNWPSGTELEVIDGAAGVMLRAKQPAIKKLPHKEAMARIHAIVDYKGPRGTDAEWNEAISEMFRNDPKWDPPSR